MTGVVWSGAAVDDLARIIEYLDRDNPAAATDVEARLLTAVDRLQAFPESGRSGRVPATRELVVPGLPYIVIYEVHADRVLILGVIHGAQRWPPADE